MDKLCSFRRKVTLFGFYFASLDIRQDSRVISRALDAVIEENSSLFSGLNDLSEAEQVDKLLNISGSVELPSSDDEVVLDTVGSFSLIDEIQTLNGEQGCHRYIISNCHGPIDMARGMPFSSFVAGRTNP